MSTNWVIKLLCVFIIGFNSSSVQCFKIYDNLLDCYRGNETLPWFPETSQMLLELIRKVEDSRPTSLDIRVLTVGLLHHMKIDGIERAVGVRETDFVTPYRASGVATPKFRLLLQLISEVPSILQFQDVLSPREMCILHRLISSSTEPYERGDEVRVCPLTMESAGQRTGTPWITRNKVQGIGGLSTIANRVSRCPLEMGSVRSHFYGSFSPGTVIASIAAGLQPQNVKISEFVERRSTKDPFENIETMSQRDTTKDISKLLKSFDAIDNIYSAGLAGDLAEVCVYQGPYMGTGSIIGLTGTWNDTYFPRARYFNENHRGRWEMTDSEILAGLDGLFLSQEISSWATRVRRLKLSQVLDMYYSPRGIPVMAIESANRKRFKINKSKVEVPGDMSVNIFEEPDLHAFVDSQNMKISNEITVKNACNRRKILDSIDREKLKDETFFLSQILQFTTISMAVSDEQMRVNCDAAVDNFFEYTETFLDTLPKCEVNSENIKTPHVDLYAILDASRSEYENQQFINHLAELSEVGSYGSWLTAIHGTSGQLLVNRTRSVANAYEQLFNFSGPYPTRLSLSNSLGTLVSLLSGQMMSDQTNAVRVGPSQVILVASQAARITETDYQSAIRLITTSLARFPDVYFIFLTNDAATFEGIGKNTRSSEQYKVLNVQSTHPDDYKDLVFKALADIPKKIMAPFCQTPSLIKMNRRNGIFFSDYFEEYASPGVELNYRIHPYYIKYTDVIRVQFQGVEYGDLSICSSRVKEFSNPECQHLIEAGIVWFNYTMPCPNADDCSGIYFRVNLERSDVRCSENDCRYPDQVRFMIRHEGLRCEIDGRSGAIRKLSSIASVFIIGIIMFLNN